MLRAVAICDHLSFSEDELSFQTGEEINVLKRVSQGWWQGVPITQDAFDNHRRRSLSPSQDPTLTQAPPKWFPSTSVSIADDNAPAHVVLIYSKVESKAICKANIEQAFVEEEKDYLASLMNLKQAYIDELMGVDWLSSAHKRLLMAPTLKIIEAQEELVQHLHAWAMRNAKLRHARAKERQNNTPSQNNAIAEQDLKVCQVAVIMCEFATKLLLCYSDYARDLPKARQQLHELLKDDRDFSAFAHEATSPSTMTTGLDLPLQHLISYQLAIDSLYEITEGRNAHVLSFDAVYQSIINVPEQIVYMKNAELGLHSAAIRRWTGPPMATMGPLRFTLKVKLDKTNAHSHNARDGLLLLFQHRIVLLSLHNTTSSTSGSATDEVRHRLVLSAAIPAVQCQLHPEHEDVVVFSPAPAASIDRHLRALSIAQRPSHTNTQPMSPSLHHHAVSSPARTQSLSSVAKAQQVLKPGGIGISRRMTGGMASSVVSSTGLSSLLQPPSFNNATAYLVPAPSSSSRAPTPGSALAKEGNVVWHVQFTSANDFSLWATVFNLSPIADLIFQDEIVPLLLSPSHASSRTDAKEVGAQLFSNNFAALEKRAKGNDQGENHELNEGQAEFDFITSFMNQHAVVTAPITPEPSEKGRKKGKPPKTKKAKGTKRDKRINSTASANGADNDIGFALPVSATELTSDAVVPRQDFEALRDEVAMLRLQLSKMDPSSASLSNKK